MHDAPRWPCGQRQRLQRPRPRRAAATGRLQSCPKLGKAVEEIRARSAFLDQDRYIAPEIEAVAQLVLSGWFRRLVEV